MKIMMKPSFVMVFLMLIGCGKSDTNTPFQEDGTDPMDSPPSLTLVNAFGNLRFDRPVDFQSPNDDSNRLFVVEQAGRILWFLNDESVSQSESFLDIRNRVDDSASEMGLLGLAFHPQFASNGYIYVNYTASGPVTVISRFQLMTGSPDRIDPDSELVLLRIPQPFGNHNAGQLAFGPDNLLYIALGDGGSGGDPQGNAQNRGNLLGNILRIDIDRTENGNTYGIPTDNPYAGNLNFRNEIYAYGLRNPWRMSFDTVTGDLWAADVGQNATEEINRIENGNNYGWNILEGRDCFSATSCDASGLTPPVFEYGQESGDRSVTGGYVYRGTNVPSLEGQYIYADFVSGRIWSLGINGNEAGTNTLLMDTNENISSFGTDANNELYLCSFNGTILKFVEN
ncbi:PQQ-dependent sugar dehydrogenase [Spongiimicrobium salis]|uniref:PQQ-dependent sugar dehydrogenase n=1 Tax=Spongiimicrobium salis TaxID=1667022 RepID=UPI00374DE085